MQIPDKDTQIHTFDYIDSDTSPEGLPANVARTMLNCRPYSLGDKGVITNIPGTTLIPNNLPSGNNIGLGWGKNEETGQFYYFNYNDQGYHGIYCYNDITQSITPVLLNLTDTNGIDILRFDPKYLINHVDIVSDNLIYWVDGLNKARKFNIIKAIDKSATGYGQVITEDFITAYKQTGVFAPTAVYFTDLTRTSNYLYALQFKFAYRFHYDDGEISNTSDFSAVPLPPNESYLGVAGITFDNNGINVTFETGNKLVTKIEVFVKVNSLDFVTCVILNKAQLGIANYSTYTYAFYNDGAFTTVDNLKVLRAYSYMPRIPFTQSFVKESMTYGNAEEGFQVVQINASVAVTYKPFYLPSGTVSQLNNPILTATLTSVSQHGGIFNSWFTTTTHFEVGADVKKGNVFTLICRGGNTSPTNQQNFNYTATIGDTASTVANQIKLYLRLIDAVGTSVISNETTDGSGNVTWDFNIEAHESKQPIEFTANVTPVNYSTLLDNGLSINTIKQGGSRKYAVVYEDDDGRTSLAYTTDSLLAKTQFETEVIVGQTGPIGLQQPIHTISIYNTPPLWAKYWRLVRVNDIPTFIQLLIQQVNTVVVANEPTYIDLIVGSLFTYQSIHPDAILKYDFERGDRLRLISKYDPTTLLPTYYTPYYETEVLEYTVDEVQNINSNIRTSIGVSSSNVTPADGVKTDFIGKNIIIQSVERTIIGISGADYVLDSPLTLINSATPDTYTVPNYTIVDRRGVIRIKQPPAGLTIVDFSLVEIYHPQVNSDASTYLNFYDFQQKYAIGNWGTPNAFHNGNIQNQNPANPITTPAIIQVTQGDAYVRNRAMPSNNQDPNPQVIIDQICDPNFSDFYVSNLYATGRVYPQDQAYGTVKFTQRIRFSNNYIENTQVNGLNDFDNTDRKDYNDPYGAIILTKFKRSFLFIFKKYKSTWTPVSQNIIVDNNNQPQLVTSDNLLNDLQYAVWEGGIGDNGSGWFENGDYQYIPSANSGVFLRIAQDGSVPISSLYSFDKRSRELLSMVNKQNLNIYGGFDRLNDEALFTIPDYTEYLYNNDFSAGLWQTVLNSYPNGTTFTITQQPAHSTATIVNGIIQITGTSTLGSDLFKFQGTLPGGGVTPVINFCFNVVANQNDATTWEIDPSTNYCLQTEILAPNEFSFTPQVKAALSTIYTSNSQEITGINAPAVTTVTGGQVSINGGAFTSSPDNINNGDNVVVRQTSSATPNTATNCVLTIAGVSATFTVTTKQSVAIAYSMTQQASPYSDGNLALTVGGVALIVVNIDGSGTVYALEGDLVEATAYGDYPSTGTSPLLHMNVRQDPSTVLYDNTIPNNPPPQTVMRYDFTAVLGDTYTVEVDATASGAAGYAVVNDTENDMVYNIYDGGGAFTSTGTLLNGASLNIQTLITGGSNSEIKFVATLTGTYDFTDLPGGGTSTSGHVSAGANILDYTVASIVAAVAAGNSGRVIDYTNA